MKKTIQAPVQIEQHIVPRPFNERPSNFRHLFRKSVLSVVLLLIFVVLIFIAFYEFPVAVNSSGWRNKKKFETNKALSNHPSFKLKERKYISEYDIECVTYIHKKTRGEIMSLHWGNISNITNIDDQINKRTEEKVFGIFFRTPIEDSTGVPHIIEHSVLCGSRKFKTKEPFSNLMQSSLNTFLNAFTWQDRTGYAFASCNDKEFQNIEDVYLDAVFYPRAIQDKLVLAQEGWHLKPKEADFSLKDYEKEEVKNVEFQYSGVVMSEMKGAFSDVDRLLDSYIQQSLFPDTSYFYNSGGNPADIPNLTFEKFKEFYHKYYHPTNAKVFLSGLTAKTEFQVLTLIDDYYKNYDYEPLSKQNSKVSWQEKNFPEPKYTRFPFPASSETLTNIVTVSWLINDEPLPPVVELALVVLDKLLLGSTSSALFKILLDSHLGTQVVSFGIDSELIQSTYTVGLKGVQALNVEKVEDLVLSSLRNLSIDGFDNSSIESAMNLIEFQFREFNTGDYPRGLSFMFASMSKWIYDYSPTDGLQFEEALNELKDIIYESNCTIFKNLLNDYFIQNQHRVTVELFPLVGLQEEQLMQENQRIQNFTNDLTDTEMRAILKQSDLLNYEQSTPDSPEEVATIPTISVKDIHPDEIEYPISFEDNFENSGITLVTHELHTSGIVYAKVVIDISVLKFEVVEMYFDLFKALLTKTGTKLLSDVALSQEIDRYTGGITLTNLITQERDVSSVETKVLQGTPLVTKLVLRGKALIENSSQMFSLMKEILMNSNLDAQDKALQILESSCESVKTSISNEGSSYAFKRLRAKLSFMGLLNEKMNGISSYFLTCDVLIKQVQTDWVKVLRNLQSIRETLLDESTFRNGMFIDLTLPNDQVNTVKPFVKQFISNLPGITNSTYPKNILPHPWVSELSKDESNLNSNEAVIVQTKVNYVSKGSQIYQQGEKVSGSSSVISRYLQNVHLWNTVRIQGGAYGAYSILQPTDGSFIFVSYRDPNIQKSLDYFDDSIRFLSEESQNLMKNPEALEKAIIGAISYIDGSPPTPDIKGWVSFQRWLTGVTINSRQNWRNEILNCKAGDFKEFADRLKHFNNSYIVIVTSNSTFRDIALPYKSFEKIPVS